jgi:hypothetical protein
MLNRSASSILVCCRSIVSTLLADVLCAVRGALCGWFASKVINEASSPGHGEQKLALAAEMAEEKTSRNSSDRGKWYDDWKKKASRSAVSQHYIMVSRNRCMQHLQSGTYHPNKCKLKIGTATMSTSEA